MGNRDPIVVAPSALGERAPAELAIALFVENAPLREILSIVSVGLGLRPVHMIETDLILEELCRSELILAEAEVARRMRPIINQLQFSGQQVKPSLVAVGSVDLAAFEVQNDDFDAVLVTPASAAELSARLSVVLYSHRALARRYRSALEELNLNRSIFRSVTNGISVSNAQLPDMPLIYVNPSFELMTGYSFEEVEGRNCRFLQDGETEQPGLTLIREAIKQERQTVAVLHNYRKDGTPFWNEFTLSPIRNREGVLTHFVGIQSDVTERIELESALRESEKLAAVGRLASSISHEINNPLEAVMNLLYLGQQVASQSFDNQESLAYLKQADEELQRVKLITAQSLRFYKQSTGPELLLARDLVSSVLDLYKSRLMNYDIAVHSRERSIAHMVGLGSELRQVLSNLVGNAIDAMKAKGGKLLVRTRETTSWSDGKNGICLTVADTGVGMNTETLKKLYKAFYTTKGVGGTGLGLWISSEIVGRHRGHLKVRSSNRTVGSYTVFQLFLPFQGAAGARLSSNEEQLS